MKATRKQTGSREGHDAAVGTRGRTTKSQNPVYRACCDDSMKLINELHSADRKRFPRCWAEKPDCDALFVVALLPLMLKEDEARETKKPSQMRMKKVITHQQVQQLLKEKEIEQA